MNYVSTKIHWNRNNVIIDEIFSYSIAIDIISDEDDVEPRTVEECRRRHDWPKWKEVMQVELKSLEKREVFGKIALTPAGRGGHGPGQHAGGPRPARPWPSTARAFVCRAPGVP